MQDNLLDIDELDKQLKQWCGKGIRINKKELRDLDHIHMKLDTISYEKNTRNIDDYVATYILHLNGAGDIQTDHTQQPLPDMVYDIPLNDSASFEVTGDTLMLQTNRAAYEIVVESQNGDSPHVK